MKTGPGLRLFWHTIEGAARATDHHLYYRSLNRLAGALCGASLVESIAPHRHGSSTAGIAEEYIEALESQLGPNLLGYGGRPLFPALRKRVAETLVELGY